MCANIAYLPSVEKVPVFVKASTAFWGLHCANEGHGGWSYLTCPVTEVRTAILQNRPHGIVTQLARGNCVVGSSPTYPI